MNETLSVLYFPTALALGALHALEPGHAKTLMASYLIGIKGTKTDSLILGISVALTHSIVVILIAAIGLWIGSEAFTDEATVWLAKGSGIIAIGIGCWMMWRRTMATQKGSCCDHDHHHHGHSHDHLPHLHSERPSTWQLIMFGAAGGMIPCPASITVLLLALSMGKTALGLFTVMGFSLGLAIALVGVGMAVVTGLSKLENDSRFSKVTQYAPVVSAGLVILSGVFALFIAH